MDLQPGTRERRPGEQEDDVVNSLSAEPEMPPVLGPKQAYLRFLFFFFNLIPVE